ncbi:MAG: fatty acid cis/trans isomerase [Polyangiales bacterium]
MLTRPRLRWYLFWPLLFASCTTTTPLSRMPDSRDTVPAVKPVAIAPVAATWSEAQHVLESRCVVCHGCYDAPCQLKLESYAGAVRGGTTTPVYDGSRLRAADPTRLGVDARLVSEWRARGFHTVIPDAPEADRQNSVLLRMLALKSAHPLAPDVDYPKTFTLELDRKASCATADQFNDFAREHPAWGMPYALPEISEKEYGILEGFIAAGAPNDPEPPLPAAVQAAIAEWEEYLNDPSPKRRLTVRYLYEHLFLASLYFKGVDDKQFFRLVRSRTPSGYPVEEIPTRRPFEDPGSAPFYYRILHRDEVRLAKTHMPYALDATRLSRYKQLFDVPDYDPGKFPSYELKVASNPFRTFEALPIASRYQFLLDEAEFFMMGFIKGPVCRGQVALNVIQESFWIAFLDPDAPFSTRLATQLANLQTHFELPAKAGSNALPVHWFAEADQHARYVRARNAAWSDAQQRGTKLDLSLIWDGDGVNDNAGLTVFRHFDSATVVKGFAGGNSKTVWVVDYPLFERIHYLLVAGFDVFGNLGHQIMTRLYMDFLRMEAEANYLSLLPIARRGQLATWWYRGIDDDAKKRVMGELLGATIQPDIQYKTPKPELELDAMLEKHLSRVLEREYLWQEGDTLGRQLQPLTEAYGPAASAWPELAFIEVETGPSQARYFTVMRDSAHSNVAKLFDEDDRRLLAEDELRIVPGFLGAYPNALFHVQARDLPQLVEAAVAVREPADYTALRTRYGVLRHSPDFWATSDRLQAAYREAQPLAAGVFDYNRLHAP